MSEPSQNRPYDPAGTRPRVDPASLVPAAPPADLPWAEHEERAESRLEHAIERLEEVRVEEEDGASQHVGRFQFILGGLIAVAVLAVAAVALVVVAERLRPARHGPGRPGIRPATTRCSRSPTTSARATGWRAARRSPR